MLSGSDADAPDDIEHYTVAAAKRMGKKAVADVSNVNRESERKRVQARKAQRKEGFSVNAQISVDSVTDENDGDDFSAAIARIAA